MKFKISSFLIGFSVPIVLGLMYASLAKHSVPCLWCNQPVENKTCLELYYGHKNVVHIQSPTGKLCFSEMCQAIYHLGGSFKDFSHVVEEATYYDLEELKK